VRRVLAEKVIVSTPLPLVPQAGPSHRALEHARACTDCRVGARLAARIRPSRKQRRGAA
jgi:hypothetical protein